MTARRAYCGPVEALPIEEWAVRFRVSADHFDRTYTGRRVYMGSLLRISAADVHDWLDGLGPGDVTLNPWASVGGGNAEDHKVQAGASRHRARS